jgi:hypothetical protein
MNYYLLAKLIHIIGALGFFIALGVEWLSLWSARNAKTSEQVRERLSISANARKLGPISMLAILLSGFAMMAIGRIGSSWLIVAFAALVVLVVLGLTLTAPRMRTLGEALKTEYGPLSSTLHDLLRDSQLWFSLRLRGSLALGIIFLMTVKPDLIGSLITMGMAILLGLAAGLSISRSRQQEKAQA